MNCTWMIVVYAVRPTKVEIAEGQLLCVVCNDIGNGVHFGAVTCEGCKVRRPRLRSFRLSVLTLFRQWFMWCALTGGLSQARPKARKAESGGVVIGKGTASPPLHQLRG